MASTLLTQIAGQPKLTPQKATQVAIKVLFERLISLLSLNEQYLIMGKMTQFDNGGKAFTDNTIAVNSKHPLQLIYKQ